MPKIGAPYYIRQMLISIKGEISRKYSHSRILTLHLDQWINPSRQKIAKETQALNDILDKMD